MRAAPRLRDLLLRSSPFDSQLTVFLCFAERGTSILDYRQSKDNPRLDRLSAIEYRRSRRKAAHRKVRCLRQCLSITRPGLRKENAWLPTTPNITASITGSWTGSSARHSTRKLAPIPPARSDCDTT